MIIKNPNPFKFLEGKNLDEFIASARARIEDKKLIGLLEELKKIG